MAATPRPRPDGDLHSRAARPSVSWLAKGATAELLGPKNEAAFDIAAAIESPRQDDVREPDLPANHERKPVVIGGDEIGRQQRYIGRGER